MSLKNKRVLITAGPTWAAIDSVRVISNTASGETGTRIAAALRKAGAEVTVLLGPCGASVADKRVKVIGFTFFDELKKLLEKELSGNRYDAIIHSAAVSDYLPERRAKGKISSNLPGLKISLARAPKLIDLIRAKAPGALLIAFKFIPGAKPKTLIAAARELGKRSRANIIVANTAKNGNYRAFVVSPQGIVPEAGSKEELVELLGMYLDAYFNKLPHSGKCSCGKC